METPSGHPPGQPGICAAGGWRRIDIRRAFLEGVLPVVSSGSISIGRRLSCRPDRSDLSGVLADCRRRHCGLCLRVLVIRRETRPAEDRRAVRAPRVNRPADHVLTLPGGLWSPLRGVSCR